MWPGQTWSSAPAIAWLNRAVAIDTHTGDDARTVCPQLASQGCLDVGVARSPGLSLDLGLAWGEASPLHRFPHKSQQLQGAGRARVEL